MCRGVLFNVDLLLGVMQAAAGALMRQLWGRCSARDS